MEDTDIPTFVRTRNVEESDRRWGPFPIEEALRFAVQGGFARGRYVEVNGVTVLDMDLIALAVSEAIGHVERALKRYQEAETRDPNSIETKIARQMYRRALTMRERGNEQ